MTCKICKSDTENFLTAPIFKERQQVKYYKCRSCNFIQTEEPTWLDKAYSDVIAKSDIGLIWRNIHFSDLLEKFLLNMYPQTGRCLDFGGGYGMFTRIMRDKGFDFHWQDDFCKNMFAEGFEGSLNDQYDVITAFEVFEHLPDPHETISKLIEKCQVLVFSTEMNDEVKDFENWWYRAELSGQHVSFFSKGAMMYLSDKYKVNYYTCDNGALRILSKIKFDQEKINAIYGPKNNSRFKLLLNGPEKSAEPRPSLLQKDHQAILDKYLKGK
jgi:hypothetical protein